MDGVADQLLISGANRMRGINRRLFQADVCIELCNGCARRAERRFGWGRDTVQKGLDERKLSPQAQSEVRSRNRGRRRSEDANPQLAIDIQLIAEPHTQADPELKSERRYLNLTSKEVRQKLIDQGYTDAELPSERTLRDILNRMNFRLKRIRKAKPLKKTGDTDAIFENIRKVRQEVADDPETLEISVDTKAKVKLGEYSQGGKNTNRLPGQRPQSK